MDQSKIADQVNAEVQRQIGRMVIEQISLQVQAQAMQARIAELEAKPKEGPM